MFLNKIFLLVTNPLVFVRKLKIFIRSKMSYVYELIDFMRYYSRSRSVTKKIKLDLPIQSPVIFVFGRGMNLTWAQIWTFLAISVYKSGTPVHFLIYPTRFVIKSYLNIYSSKNWCFSLLKELAGHEYEFRRCEDFKTLAEIKDYRFKELPVGQMILSTYARYNVTGEIDISSKKFIDFFEEWHPIMIDTYLGARIFFENNKFSTIIFSETFCEEYGAIYYAAMEIGLDVIKTSGTVRDNSILVQRRNMSNARKHHASLSKKSLEQLLERVDPVIACDMVIKNFNDRYGDKWHRSARNNKNSRNISREKGRQELGIKSNDKVVIIYSHILYDALFHYGEELYDDYATWLVRTVALAVKNANVEWYIKYHPSNLWRGEFDTVLNGQFEEDRILDLHFPELPKHIHKIYPSTEFSPLTWMRVADIGISVRGTSGIEMACLGKSVITAGTGRYEGHGFTVEPKSVEEYVSFLQNIHAIQPLDESETMLANIYAHGLFNLKPFFLKGMESKIITGKSVVNESDDMFYLPSAVDLDSKDWAPSVFYDFLFSSDDEDLIDLS